MDCRNPQGNEVCEAAVQPSPSLWHDRYLFAGYSLLLTCQIKLLLSLAGRFSIVCAQNCPIMLLFLNLLLVPKKTSCFVGGVWEGNEHSGMCSFPAEKKNRRSILLR